jgi:hypothetical protein
LFPFTRLVNLFWAARSTSFSRRLSKYPYVPAVWFLGSGSTMIHYCRAAISLILTVKLHQLGTGVCDTNKRLL